VIVAVIPAYEEAPRVGAVVAGANAQLPVLVVDDGSTDGTAAVAEAAGATVLRQRPNQGKGAALRAGFRWALDHDFEAALTLDADGQHDPAEIPALLAARARTGADLIIGRRDFGRMPPIRQLSNRLGGLAFSWAVGRRIPDNQSGYRLVSRRLMEAMLASGESGFEPGRLGDRVGADPDDLRGRAEPHRPVAAFHELRPDRPCRSRHGAPPAGLSRRPTEHPARRYHASP
jgi:glycosyltransferase involved in cell wall biosynthesis